jgi:hypothetical protein
MSKKNKAFRIKPDTVFREEEEGAFLFDPDTGRVCYLNEMGRMLWGLCEKNKSPQQMVEEVCAQYPAEPPDKIAKDCNAFFDELERLTFVSEQPAE